MPARGQRSGLCFAVSDNARDDQIRVVERGAIGMREGVTELAALMHRTRRLRCHVAGNSPGKRELGKEAFHAFSIAGNVRVNLAIRALKISVRNQPRATMAGAGYVDHVQVVLFDQAVQVNVNEIQARRGSPVAEKAGLYVFLGERPLQQWVVVEIDLADRKVVGSPPV